SLGMRGASVRKGWLAERAAPYGELPPALSTAPCAMIAVYFRRSGRHGTDIRAISKDGAPMTDDHKTGTPKDSHYARLRRTHRDQPGKAQPAARRRPPSEPGTAAPDGLVRLYGLHTVRAAIDNPKRRIARLLVTLNAKDRLGIADIAALPFPAEIVDPKTID